MLTKKVREVLERATNPYSRGLGTDDDEFGLLKELKTIQVNSKWFFFAAAVMCVLIFLLIIYLILTNQNDIRYLTAVYSIGGVSLAGLVTLMIKLGKTYTESSLVLVLASKLPTDDIRAVLNALLAPGKSADAQDVQNSK